MKRTDALWPVIACALCTLQITGCLLQPDPAAPNSQDFTAAWHEDAFARALVFGDDGLVVCAGTRCRQIEDTLGTGSWDTSGTTLTLTGVSGHVWWPGGSGLSQGAATAFEYEISDTNLTLLPPGGGALTYTRVEPPTEAECPVDTNLHLLFPRGGEVFEKNVVIRIRWRASGVISSVVVDFSSDGGKSYWNICGRSIVPSDSTWFDWVVEPFDDPAPECYMRVFDYGNNELGFSSSGAFVID
jgi:hypothetical protein